MYSHAKFLPTLSLSLALLLSGCGSAPSDTEAGERPALQKVGTTTLNSPGMVAAANPLAVDAGLEILRAGGSAVDAAVAVQTMLGLVEPQSSGLGGGAFMVIYDPKTAQVWSYNGRETAPAGVTPEMFLDDEGAPLRYFDGIASGRSTGVPGAMVMLHAAHEDYGILPWATAFEPAIKTAEDGFAVSPRMASIVARMGRLVLNRQDATREYFYVDGDGETPIPEGFIRDNPAYADTLRALQGNPRALLEGPIAQAIIDAVAEAPLPGSLTLADMADYRPQKTEALCSTYRAHIICGAQPPASGPLAVQSILGMLETFDMAALGRSEDGWHKFIEASFLAYADRSHYVADPDFVDVPTGLLLNKDYLASRAGMITDRALGEYSHGNPAAFLRGTDATPDSPGTSHFTVVDKNGLTVSITTTVEAPFGSQRMAGGFMLNNQLTDFSFAVVDEAGLPIANAPAPGKRPRSSMAPLIVFNPDGEFLFTTGSPGGNSIIAYTAKTVVGMIDWGLTPQEAIELPNVIARRGRVSVEAKGIRDEETDEIDRGSPAETFGMDAALLAALEARGHNIRRSKGEFSGLHIIYRNADGTLTGGADPRREGKAVAP